MNLHGFAEPRWAQLLWSHLRHLSVAGADQLGRLGSRCLSSSSWKLQASLGVAFLHRCWMPRGQARVCRPVPSLCLHCIYKHSIGRQILWTTSEPRSSEGQCSWGGRPRRVTRQSVCTRRGVRGRIRQSLSQTPKEDIASQRTSPKSFVQ